MPHYDSRDLVTDDDAYYTKEELKDILNTAEPERVTYAEYSEMLKAWILLDDYTGKLYLQPIKQINYIEFEITLKEGQYEYTYTAGDNALYTRVDGQSEGAGDAPTNADGTDSKNVDGMGQ